LRALFSAPFSTTLAYEHGARTLTKQEAVAMLCDKHGFAPSTAYLVVKTDGAFRAHLRESKGKLSWTALPLADAAEPPLPPLPEASQAA
jgi:hypothetical protein